ncbi:MAG: hypothetical protein FJX72_10560 [Armatimonadetes bacterium]|nr:hypothetical protein [Armatimonadota bacterium]
MAHAGRRSLYIADRTPHQAYRYVLVNTNWIAAKAETTYILRFQVRGRSVGRCFVGVACEGAGEHRQPLPTGTYDWREATFRFTTPGGSGRIQVQFAADDVAELWFDDVSLEVSPVQLAGIAERRRAGQWKNWYPRTEGPVPQRLAVLDISKESSDVGTLMVALQGLANRDAPRLYLINPTNPGGYDEMWLRYMQEKRYTGAEERLATPEDAIERFRRFTKGAIVWDDALPGSRHAAWMLGSIKGALPASAEAAKRFGLPIVEDLRGRWKRNVDAYRYVWEKHRADLSADILAWEYPLTNALSSRDVMMQKRVFMFWVSAPLDNEPGADPIAEMQFVEEVLSGTPGNIPVMGWPMHVIKGVEEYTAVRLLSEFAKWVPGTGFNSNGTVHSAIRPNPSVFARAFDPSDTKSQQPQKDKVYLSVNILDSGDAQWYWQFHQRRIWADPARGSVPIGYGMNMTLVDALPLVAHWYYENRTPKDSFFGLMYMNAPVYASRFRKEDRERIWAEYVRLTGTYLKRMGMEGLELYTGGSGGPRGSGELLRRFTRGIPGLRYILAGLGRHGDVKPETANGLLENTAVFQTLTNFRVWSLDEDLTRKKMADENAWLLGEIAANAPTSRPGFMSAMAISWIYFPAWIADLKAKLPPQYVLVSPADLARLYRKANE